MTHATRFDRLGVADLTTLATDRGQVPMNIGAVLMLGPCPASPEQVAHEIAGRLARVPRFRQRLFTPPFGAGRQLWVDDERFDLTNHVRQVRPRSVDEQGVLDAAAQLVVTRLPAQRPLWTMGWIAGLPDARMAIVLVFHHVLADGMGGLAVLTSLADGLLAPTQPARPTPIPSRRALTADAMRARTLSVAGVPASARQAWAGLRELGILRQRPRSAARTSLTRSTSGRRTIRIARAPLSDLLDVAHQHRATLNDAVLAAVTGALFEVLDSRGERPPELVVSVPVSMRGSSSADDLGNHVGVAPVTVAFEPDPSQRLRAISAATRQAKQQTRGQSGLVLSWLFRTLAAVHLGQYFVDHQRLVHTFETNLRGPDQIVHIAGCALEQIVPVAVNPGNVTVSFDVLSYAGHLVISIVADPETVPDVDRLAELLRAELRALITHG